MTYYTLYGKIFIDNHLTLLDGTEVFDPKEEKSNQAITSLLDKEFKMSTSIQERHKRINSFVCYVLMC